MIKLRKVQDEDLQVFFALLQDVVSVKMAGFTSKDPSDKGAHDDHWAKIRSQPDTTISTILFEHAIVGYVASFNRMDDLEVTYWIHRGHWGRGIATEALRLFLEVVEIRPIHGRVAKDNLGSIRVLQKNGFEISGEDKRFAHGRGEEIEEFILRLG